MTQQLTFLPKHKYLKYIITNRLEVYKDQDGVYTIMANILLEGNLPPILYPIGHNSYETFEEAQLAIEEKTYRVSADLVSFCENHKNDFRHSCLSITYPHVDEIGGDWVITSHSEEYHDDSPNITSIEAVISEESWKSKELAEHALKEGDYTLIWELTIPLIAVERYSLTIVEDDDNNFFIARPYVAILGKSFNSLTSRDTAMLDYHEYFIRKYPTACRANEALRAYLDELKVKLPETANT